MGPKPRRGLGEKRETWKEQETETLVEHFILKRYVIFFACGV